MTQTLNELKDRTLQLLTQDSAEVRHLFLRTFIGEVSDFSSSTAEALYDWHKWNNHFMNSDVKHEHEDLCINLMLSVISLQLQSMQLFLSGFFAPSGNTKRQVLETIALAFLCADDRLDVCKKFLNKQYSVHKSIRDLKRHHKSMGVSSEAVEFMEFCIKQLNQLSHATNQSLGSSRTGNGFGVFLGPGFDESHINSYKIEISHRVGMATKLCNIMLGVKQVVNKSLDAQKDGTTEPR